MHFTAFSRTLNKVLIIVRWRLRHVENEINANEDCLGFLRLGFHCPYVNCAAAFKLIFNISFAKDSRLSNILFNLCKCQ